MRRLNLIGKSFGKLTVVALDEKKSSDRRRAWWVCRCSCGSLTVRSGASLMQSEARSCGCYRTKHGLHKHSAYSSWLQMMDRCHNRRSKDFKRYGARGIKVCRRWRSVTNFVKDMGEKPKGLSIERKKNNGDYTPKNCMWATAKQQAINRRSNVLLTIDGVRKPKSEWCESFRLERHAMDRFLKIGLSPEKALLEAVRVRCIS